mgnify:CR=1 FL=1
MKSAKIVVMIAVSALLLAGCETQSPKSGDNSQPKHQAKSSSITKHKATEVVAKKASSSQATGSSSSKQSTTPWTQAKSVQLASFMKSRGQTMNQSYTAYTPGHGVIFYGTSEPDGMNSEPPAAADCPGRFRNTGSRWRDRHFC